MAADPGRIADCEGQLTRANRASAMKGFEAVGSGGRGRNCISGVESSGVEAERKDRQSEEIDTNL